MVVKWLLDSTNSYPCTTPSKCLFIAAAAQIKSMFSDSYWIKSSQEYLRAR